MSRVVADIPRRLNARIDGPCPVRVFIDGTETPACVWYDLDAQTVGLVDRNGLRTVSGVVVVLWKD